MAGGLQAGGCVRNSLPDSAEPCRGPAGRERGGCAAEAGGGGRGARAAAGARRRRAERAGRAVRLRARRPMRGVLQVRVQVPAHARLFAWWACGAAVLPPYGMCTWVLPIVSRGRCLLSL